MERKEEEGLGGKCGRGRLLEVLSRHSPLAQRPRAGWPRGSSHGKVGPKLSFKIFCKTGSYGPYAAPPLNKTTSRDRNAISMAFRK